MFLFQAFHSSKLYFVLFILIFNNYLKKRNNLLIMLVEQIPIGTDVFSLYILNGPIYTLFFSIEQQIYLMENEIRMNSIWGWHHLRPFAALITACNCGCSPEGYRETTYTVSDMAIHVYTAHARFAYLVDALYFKTERTNYIPGLWA